MNLVAVEGVYIWIEYEVSLAYEMGEQERLFCDLLEPLGLTYCGSGGFLGSGWRDIDFNVPVGTDLHVIRDVLDVDLGFRFIASPEYLPSE